MLTITDSIDENPCIFTSFDQEDSLKNDPSQSYRRIVVVGDEGVGKTSFIHAFFNRVVSKDHLPTIEDTFLVPNHDNVVIVDTAGASAFDRLRYMSYMRATDAIICFSVDSIMSFHHLQEWIDEVKYLCRDVPFTIIGLKTDHRETKDPSHVVSAQEAQKYAHKVGAYAYFECSSYQNIPDIQKIMRTILLQPFQRGLELHTKATRSCSTPSDIESIDSADEKVLSEIDKHEPLPEMGETKESEKLDNIHSRSGTGPSESSTLTEQVSPPRLTMPSLKPMLSKSDTDFSRKDRYQKNVVDGDASLPKRFTLYPSLLRFPTSKQQPELAEECEPYTRTPKRSFTQPYKKSIGAPPAHKPPNHTPPPVPEDPTEQRHRSRMSSSKKERIPGSWTDSNPDRSNRFSYASFSSTLKTNKSTFSALLSRLFRKGD